MEFIRKKNKIFGLVSALLIGTLLSCQRDSNSKVVVPRYGVLLDHYIEAWCRPSSVDATTEGMEARVQAPLDTPEALSLLLSSDQGEAASAPSPDTYQPATRTKDGDSLVYESASMKLTVDLGAIEPNHKYRALFRINDTDYPVLCRVQLFAIQEE